MKPRRNRYNTKRKLVSAQEKDRSLASRISYGGNPEHKRNPGDFGLTPPAAHCRADKSLCDDTGILTRAAALKLLRAGVRRGLMSEQRRNGWPQNIWAVTDAGEPLEAMLENPEQGAYHGYPMPENDPFRIEILKCWQQWP
ncbi:MAG: hypothetical protein K9L88_17260 [Chromatiaceae bacterium]|nr:hypothetical protein [Chromatiaceae bacterium]MCF8016943.1 hypothetical protein [Chromatiaceae bacterium]